MKKLSLAYLFIIFLSYSCTDNITNQNNSNSNSLIYKKVFTVDTTDIKFEIWKLNDSLLYSGYNEIGFKVFVSNVEVKSGFVKFTPIMYHTGGVSHSTPVSEYFYYDSQKSLYTGYACFLMASDSSTSFWYANYDYNGEKIIKSKQFSVLQADDFQMRFWVDLNTMESYSLSIISPKNPVQGINEFKCILHKKDSNLVYREVDSTEMMIGTVKIQSLLLPNNQNPVWIGGGKYLGSVNFPSSGKWSVRDSIKLNGNFITGINPPTFYFDVK